MASLRYNGGASDFADKLLVLGDQADSVARQMLYVGAGDVADALRAAAQTLPVGTPKGNSETGHPYTGLTPDDKADIIDAVGIAKFESGPDDVNTAVSFSGYVRRTEKNYHDGVPVAVIVRGLESGSSVRTKHPFVRPAINAVKAKTLGDMQRVFDDEINKIMGG